MVSEHEAHSARARIEMALGLPAGAIAAQEQSEAEQAPLAAQSEARDNALSRARIEQCLGLRPGSLDRDALFAELEAEHLAVLKGLPVASVGEAQLLPFGSFAARDGRPGPGRKWKVSNEAGRALAAKLNAVASVTPVVIDYEHQTLLAQHNGKAAPAAGWIVGAEWRDGQGLFARVQWTAAARAQIEAGAYRYISPVIRFDGDGTVTEVQLAGITNHPALLGMAPLK